MRTCKIIWIYLTGMMIKIFTIAHQEELKGWMDAQQVTA